MTMHDLYRAVAPALSPRQRKLITGHDMRAALGAKDPAAMILALAAEREMAA